jgi:hypothetical protein
MGEVWVLDAPLTVRAVAGAVLGILVLGFLGDEEIESRREGLFGVLAKLLINGLDTADGGRHD